MLRLSSARRVLDCDFQSLADRPELCPRVVGLLLNVSRVIVFQVPTQNHLQFLRRPSGKLDRIFPSETDRTGDPNRRGLFIADFHGRRNEIVRHPAYDRSFEIEIGDFRRSDRFDNYSRLRCSILPWESSRSRPHQPVHRTVETYDSFLSKCKAMRLSVV